MATWHFGGFLMGVREDTYKVEDSEAGDLYVSMVLRHIITNHRCKLIIVYGPTHHDKSVEFIVELFIKCLFAPQTVVLMDIFIDLHQLQEMSGPRYTWTSKQSDPIMMTLDKIQVSTEWESNVLYVLHGAKLELDQVNGQSF
jgi:hypothetical protein